MKKLAYGVNSFRPYHTLPTTHAEMDVLRKLRFKREKPTKIDLFVIRITSTGLIRESRPCYHCLIFMEKSGFNINYIYYSTKDGLIVRERFCCMKESKLTYISHGFRRQFRKSSKRGNK